MRKTNVRRFGALLVGLALFAAACGDDDDDDAASDTTAAAEGTEAPADTTAAPEGTEAPGTTAGGEGGAAGTLAGLKGTTPLVELSEDFRTRLDTIDPNLTDVNYAGRVRWHRVRQRDQRRHPRG
jgi:hypothetical protein